MGFEPKIDILPPAQRNFWEEAPSIPASFVLYGGTAIALRLGHRSSEDFDFFSSDVFEVGELLDDLTFSRNAEVLQSAQNTLTLRVERGGPVKLFFFGGLTFGQIAAPDTIQGQSFAIASLLARSVGSKAQSNLAARRGERLSRCRGADARGAFAGTWSGLRDCALPPAVQPGHRS